MTEKTVGSHIDELHEKREERKRLEARIAVLRKEIKALEAKTFVYLDAQNITGASGRLASVSSYETTVFNPDDWDLFWDYVYQHKYGHLLQRRLSAESCREIFALQGVIPGITPAVIRKLHVNRK